jgi:hypothetical protein
MKFLSVKLYTYSYNFLPLRTKFSSSSISHTLNLYSLTGWESYIHTHAKQDTFIFCIGIFKQENGKAKYSEHNGSKHSPNLIVCYFPHESNYDLSLSSPNIWTSPHFKRLVIFILRFCSAVWADICAHVKWLMIHRIYSKWRPLMSRFDVSAFCSVTGV